MGSVAAEDLVKAYGPNRVVDHISFKVAEGEFLVVLGPSGCGKSTLLRLIAGLDDPDSGKIRIGGRDVTGVPGSERGIAMVFQSYALFPHLNVAENITFGLSIRRIAAAERAKRLKRVSELLNLGALLDRKPGQLSGGQQQRVALGRALVAETSVCLMDEPLSNLDAQLRADLRSEIRALQQRLGITLIFVTHDQAEAMSMADRVLLLRGGKIEQLGTPHQLYAHPGSIFVARFLGSPAMNFIDLTENVPGFEGIGERTMTAGLRPEDIRLTLHENGMAQVEASEYLGADCLVTCRLGENRLTIRQNGRNAAQIGARAQLNFDPAAIHLFDTKTGQRLHADVRNARKAHEIIT
ncbi:MAG: ABC transporter ATP-binding protein [Hyphomicrobiales bacterium]|nr:ABC transporter ATP-binding protein [Hyphomicrobiales bacterium]MDE2116196.1 ABC transporter ATP-binding protein [Hyphomicrobiales bacterium]